MGVTTKADELIESAREHIDQAHKAILEIVVNKCWGHDEFTQAYSESLKELVYKVLPLAKELIK